MLKEAFYIKGLINSVSFLSVVLLPARPSVRPSVRNIQKCFKHLTCEEKIEVNYFPVYI